MTKKFISIFTSGLLVLSLGNLYSENLEVIPACYSSSSDSCEDVDQEIENLGALQEKHLRQARHAEREAQRLYSLDIATARQMQKSAAQHRNIAQQAECRIEWLQERSQSSMNQ